MNNLACEKGYSNNNSNDYKKELTNDKDENKIDINNIDDIITKKKKKFINIHTINMNNYYEPVKYDREFIIDNIYTSDPILMEKIYNKITSQYQKKINLIYSLLSLDIDFDFSTESDIKKFFNWISPLNIEYKMGSPVWNHKIIRYGNKKKILFQNSVSKQDITDSFYNNYIEPIKKILKKSKIEYYYFEFKSKRFNKIKDIIFAVSC